LKTIGEKSGDAEVAKTLINHAKKSLAEHVVPVAERACRSQSWLTCHRYAIEALGYWPGLNRAQELMRQAEKGMKKTGVPFTPWSH